MFSFIISIVVNIGMWFERFVIIVTLYIDYLPSLDYVFTNICRYWNFIGTIGFFCILLLYSFPVIAQAEVKTILKATGDNFIKGRAANKDKHHE
jgi:molybdopterin-containing oxidoreductase family membrane subunit